MTTWETYIANVEEDEFLKWAEQISDRIWSDLVTLSYRRNGCFKVTHSVKDADLLPCGCYGITDIKITGEDTISVTFAQHWARDWCDTCDEAHRISDFGEFCESTDSDVDHEERTESVTFTIPQELQENPNDGGMAGTRFALYLLQQCELWSEVGE